MVGCLFLSTATALLGGLKRRGGISEVVRCESELDPAKENFLHMLLYVRCFLVLCLPSLHTIIQPITRDPPVDQWLATLFQRRQVVLAHVRMHYHLRLLSS